MHIRTDNWRNMPQLLATHCTDSEHLPIPQQRLSCVFLRSHNINVLSYWGFGTLATDAYENVARDLPSLFPSALQRRKSVPRSLASNEEVLRWLPPPNNPR